MPRDGQQLNVRPAEALADGRFTAVRCDQALFDRRTPEARGDLPARGGGLESSQSSAASDTAVHRKGRRIVTAHDLSVTACGVLVTRRPATRRIGRGATNIEEAPWQRRSETGIWGIPA
jgi:hypothetical protein